jgi:hypothetical protein
MTRLADRKTRLSIETSALYRGRPLVLEPQNYEILIRVKGKRLRYGLPYVAIFDLGAKIMANEKRREKLERKKRGLRS